MESQDDLQLINLVRAGQTDAYRELVRRYQNQVLNVVFRIVGQKEDAEELSQDVFLKAFNALDSFEGRSKFSTWLYRIASNTALSFVRKKKADVLPLNDDVFQDITGEPTERESFTEEQLQCLDQAVCSLKDVDRMLIECYYQQDLSIADLAEVCGISESNVKTRLFRARKEIGDYIRKYANAPSIEE